MPSPSPELTPPRLTDGLRANLRWVTVPSWFLSGLFHAVLAGLLILLSQLPSCQADMAGDEGDSFRDVGIHVRSSNSESVNEAESKSNDEPNELVYENPLAVQEPKLDEAPPVELNLPKVDLARPVIGAGSIPIPSTLATNDLLQPNQSTNSRPNQAASGAPVAGGTSFLGIEDVGRRFVYVIDRSFSMDNDNALQAAKTELLSSISRLNETQQFQIIFYSGTVQILEPRHGRSHMFFGTDIQRIQVSGRLNSVRASGGTRHYPALVEALKANADVIYLLTDGATESALSAADLEQIKKRNRSGTRIHCIEFGRSAKPALDGAGNFLRELAKQNHGQYVYRNVKRR
jgi:hypothetical protein